MTKKSQKEYLSSVKKTLEARFGKMTWDAMALKAGIEPRTLKTYRMPESSVDYRPMPTVARQAIESLISHPMASKKDVGTLAAALSSLVLAQAKISIVDNQIITGMDWRPGARNGLNVESRKIMAMVSRYCLESGLRDYGGEIHDLLFHCTKPFDTWLKVPALIEAGYGQTVLIDPDYGIPTPEAQELAADFSTVTARLEENLFASLKESLGQYPVTSGNEYYTAIRDFIVRNPVVTAAKLFEPNRYMPASLWMSIQQEYFEPVPHALATDGKVILCAHCNSMMKPAKSGGGLCCQSRACRVSRAAKTGSVLPVIDARRVKRGIHQYWVEPGIDEILLFDAIVAAGVDALLYPFQDRVDIAVGTIGMDLKTFVSPEILGAKFRKGIGGLAYYETKWLVVPDWLLKSAPAYMSRLEAAMGDNAKRVRCLSLSQALKDCIGGKHHA